MSRMKLLLSLLIILLAVALVGGATMAWFTAQDSVAENEFVAGTVKISANRTASGKIIANNWNPGDTTDLEICVDNEGSKRINLRARVGGYWIPSTWRLLVIYSGGDIQLLVVDWDSTKGCTGSSGPIATGDFSYVLGSSSYMVGTFSNLSNQEWIQNGSGYSVWCADSSTTISGSQTGVQIFDPFCNENWYQGLNIGKNEQWKSIPWIKIAYIINKSPQYLVSGKNLMDIQQAIWFFTNGEYASGQGGDITVDGRADQIVADTNDNYMLPVENVTFAMPSTDWHQGADGWWYYKGIVNGKTDTNTPKVCFRLPVYLDPLKTGNQYQGAQFWLSVEFEAVQASNQASNAIWQMSYDGTNWVAVPLPTE